MTRLYVYLVGGLAALLLVGGLWAWGQQGHAAARQARTEAQSIATQRDSLADALEAANRRMLRGVELSILRIATAEAQLKAANARARKLEDALKSNPDWADAPVPGSVLDALGADGIDAPGPAPDATAGGLPSAGAAGPDQR